MKVLYLCSSQFSGSTLASFLLNLHDRIASIGHTMGWNYADDEDFRCSCGEKLDDCPLFRHVAAAYAENGLHYDPRNLDTRIYLSDHGRMNQLLVGPLPILKWTPAELLRDALVRVVPPWRKTLKRQLGANRVLMQTVIDHLGAEIYLDNSHSPYRMRALARDAAFEVTPMHLIRDPRGVSLSLMSNSGYSSRDAVDSWLKHQRSIYRIAAEIGEPVMVEYESLCRETDRELGRIHEALGLPHQSFGGDFKDGEHHILGNRMRLTPGTVRLDERWRTDLDEADLKIIEDRLREFREQNSSHPLAGTIDRYLAV